MARQKSTHDPFRWFDSSSEVIRLVVMKWGDVGTLHCWIREPDAPGDTGFQVWDIGLAKIGAMICFDWYYPEAARTLALKGAEIICHPSNLILPNCPDSMPVRCLENRVFAITCNRTGSEARGGKDQLTFIGNSEVVAPKGAILHRAPRDKEELCIVEIDPADARNKALTPYNDLLRDRRESLYR